MNILEKAVEIKNEYGKTISRQILEMLSLYRKSRLLPSEYYDFRLYENKYPETFIGIIKSNLIWDYFNEPSCIDHVINNKDLFCIIYDDIPQPNLITTLPFSMLGYTDFCNNLETNVTVFVKPVQSYGGKGCFTITKLEENRFLLKNGRELIREEIIDLFDFQKYPVYMVQETLKPNPELSKYTESSSIGALRIITRIDELDNYSIIGMFTKFVGKHNDVDYTSLYGNFLVGVNNFVLTHALENSNNVHNIKFTELNGSKIQGTKIPYAKEIKKSVEKWSKMLYKDSGKKVRLLGWDIAITEDGFCCLETNLKPGFASLQKSCDFGYSDVINTDIKFSVNIRYTLTVWYTLLLMFIGSLVYSLFQKLGNKATYYNDYVLNKEVAKIQKTSKSQENSYGKTCHFDGWWVR